MHDRQIHSWRHTSPGPLRFRHHLYPFTHTHTQPHRHPPPGTFPFLRSFIHCFFMTFACAKILLVFRVQIAANGWCRCVRYDAWWAGGRTDVWSCRRGWANWAAKDMCLSAVVGQHVMPYQLLDSRRALHAERLCEIKSNRLASNSLLLPSLLPALGNRCTVVWLVWSRYNYLSYNKCFTQVEK